MPKCHANLAYLVIHKIVTYFHSHLCFGLIQPHLWSSLMAAPQMGENHPFRQRSCNKLCVNIQKKFFFLKIGTINLGCSYLLEW